MRIPHLPQVDTVDFTVDPTTGTVTATTATDPRRVIWSPVTGNAHIDDNPRIFGFHLNLHAFEVYARELFAVAAMIAEYRPCCGEGHGWVHHYGWTADGRFADQPTPCGTCNTGVVAA